MLQNVEMKTEVIERGQTASDIPEAGLIQTCSPQFIMSSFRNFGGQDNAPHSSLETLIWLSGTCTRSAIFLKPCFSGTITGTHTFRHLPQGEMRAGRKLSVQKEEASDLEAGLHTKTQSNMKAEDGSQCPTLQLSLQTDRRLKS